MGMIQITPQMRVLVAIEAADFRRGIDGLASFAGGRSAWIHSAGRSLSSATGGPLL